MRRPRARTLPTQGLYSLCFSNKHSSYSDKTVSFSIHVGEGDQSSELARQEHLAPVDHAVMLLREQMRSVEEEQRCVPMSGY
jgi:hypothetical protein